jgi:acyl-coenzyme A thioesterase PaaI-like protein
LRKDADSKICDQDVQERSPSSMSGLDYLNAIRRKGINELPFLNTVDQIVEIEHGRVVFTIEPPKTIENSQQELNPSTVCGALVSAVCWAVQSALRAGVTYTLTSLNVSFFRSITSVSQLKCEGRWVDEGRGFVLAQGKIVDEQGVIYTRADATCVLHESGSIKI